MNGRSPIQKGIRQPGMSNNPQQMAFGHPSPSSQAVAKLVDYDDDCNRKTYTPPDNKLIFLQDIRNSKECRVLYALFDYREKHSPDDLLFHKGDHLETTTEYMKKDVNWWLARSKTTREVGYVPSNYVTELNTIIEAPWYFGEIHRVAAETLLKRPENKDGAFIIRRSQTSKPHGFSLSLKHDNVIKHYRIVPHEAGGYYIRQTKLFSTLYDLVAHYSAAADGLFINLREPCKPGSYEPPPAAGLSHDTCDYWEIDRNRLTLKKEIGRGQFGQVYEGLFDGKMRVAIKTLKKDSMDPNEFLAEAQIMKKMRHKHLVRLHAVCTREEPVYIVTELMPKGALINYLQTEEGKNLRLETYIMMASQIADGMRYLEEEKFVHRDLAARNILVGDVNICKIADFGLARFIRETEYEAHAGARFPIKWTAPEAANHSKFSIKSDVWSFGIVLYEIVTKGGTPYPDMTNAEVLDRIGKGYRMPQPPNCVPKYYSIMLECWHKEPQRRPTFDALYHTLENFFESDQQYKEASQFRELCQ